MYIFVQNVINTYLVVTSRPFWQAENYLCSKGSRRCEKLFLITESNFSATIYIRPIQFNINGKLKISFAFWYVLANSIRKTKILDWHKV